MRGSINFRRGMVGGGGGVGGGDVQVHWTYKNYVGLSFSEVQGGFGGDGLFPIETHITCDFHGGPDPISLYLEDHIFF